MDFRFARKKLKRGVLILESHQSFVNLELEFLSEYNSKSVKVIYDYWKNNKKRKNQNWFYLKFSEETNEIDFLWLPEEILEDCFK